MSPTFRYSAKDAEGRNRKGFVEALDQTEAIARLRAQGLWILELKLGADKRIRTRSRRSPSTKELAILSRQLSAMLGAGIPLLEALRVVGSGASVGRVAPVLEEVAATVEDGGSLTAALQVEQKYLPEIFYRMVAAGEAGGLLEEIFIRLAEHFEREGELRGRVVSALVYPAVVMSVALAVLLLLILFVVPTFVQMFTQLHTPISGTTQDLVSLSGLLRRLWYLWPLLLGAGVATGKAIFRREGIRAQLDRLVLRVPVLGPVIAGWDLARFARTLATLLGAGVGILEALEVAEGVVANRSLREVLRGARGSLEGGGGLTDSLRAGKALPPILVEMIGSGEESGTLDQMLGKAADFMEDEVKGRVGRLTAAIEPVVIVILGVVVAFIMVSILTPMFDIFKTIP